MTLRGIIAAAAAVFGLGIVTLTGCGGGNSGGGGGGNINPPAISSFTASPASITAGSSASLTGVFSNGTGVITPGNTTVTSGTAVSVSPTTTTTYTLTVSGSGGPTVTSTATVTVTPAPPAITSFTASPATVTDGQSSSLTAVFTGGTGVVTPGNISVTSGAAVSVTPPSDTTTTYTLTVTPASGTAITQTTTVTAVPAPAISSFTASPAAINSGSSASLTAVFTGSANGTAVVSPGNISIGNGSNGSVTVKPTATTTYTLTVTNSAGMAVTQTTTVTVNAPPVITSFMASPTTISPGGISNLTAVFTGGTGSVSPGNIAILSGTPVPISPVTTTTYTLTVTPTTGTAITQQATVTVVAAPVITSFTANPASILAGNTSALTGVFTGGTGLITPGNYTASSGDSVSVGPASTTTYTLTVKNAAGTTVTSTATVTVTSATTVTVNPSNPGISVTDQILGVNLEAWYVAPSNASSANSALNQAGMKAVRWPGGSWSDVYHWGYQTSSSTLTQPYMCTCSSATSCTANDTTGWAGNQTFAQFATMMPEAGPFDLALTADYGTNESCTGGGDPKEAAAWAAAAITDGITPSHITVGNEEYGTWETDLHAKPNDPATYAASVVGSSGYYSLIKAASPNTLVGVVVDADCSSSSGCTGGWDTTVLSSAAGSYDFVEYHYYPQYGDVTSDTPLVHQYAQQFTTNIQTLRTELTTAGKASTPIYVGELGGNSANPGTQSWSITQGLFAGQIIGEAMNDGVSRLTWWDSFGNCFGAGNNSSSLYGWQDWGAQDIFSAGPSVDTNCPGDGAIGTMSPTAEAFNLFQNVAVTGEHVLTPTVGGDTADVHAYAATHSGGTALVLFNLNQTSSQTVSVALTGVTGSTDVTVITYDKEIYDYTNTNCALDPSCTVDPNHNYSNIDWALPASTDMGTQSLPLTLTLTPWSMNVVLIK
jgi:hypothetical protein